MSKTQHTIRSFEKSSDLFFHDGDIVIAAQRPDDDTFFLFKLHRRVLATHAQAFHSLLIPPSVGTDVNEYFEGTPIVRLFDDPVDLAKFFKAMYVPSSLIFRRLIATNAADAYPLLVLADKYVADDIECMIECQIRQDWPNDVHEWDAFESHAMHMYHITQFKGEEEDAWNMLVPEPASYIRLARLVKVRRRTRVAAAFYLLSQMRESNSWETNGITHLAYIDPTPGQLVRMRRAMWSILTEDEMRRIQRGRERVANHMANYTRMLHEQISFQCSCAHLLQEVVERMGRPDRDALADLLELCNIHTPVMYGMCNTCRGKVKQKSTAEREALFCKFPEYFEVQGNERAYNDSELIGQ